MELCIWKMHFLFYEMIFRFYIHFPKCVCVCVVDLKHLPCVGGGGGIPPSNKKLPFRSEEPLHSGNLT